MGVHKLWHTLRINNGTWVFTFTLDDSSGVHKSCSILSFYPQTSSTGCGTWIEIDLKCIQQCFYKIKKKPQTSPKQNLYGIYKVTHIYFFLFIRHLIKLDIIYFSRKTRIRHWRGIISCQVWEKYSLAVQGPPQILSIYRCVACLWNDGKNCNLENSRIAVGKNTLVI